MKYLEQKLEQLNQLLIKYQTEELSLQDINSMDNEFEDIVNIIREIKNQITLSGLFKRIK